MTKSNQTLIAGTVKLIALNRLVPSKENVRQHYDGASVRRLAANISSRGLLQNLTIRPAPSDDAGTKDGAFEVVAGGRRLAALMLLAKRRKIAADQPVRCILRSDGIAADLSLAENFERDSLHPADEFEAFRTLHADHGQSVDEIAARYGVTTRLVRQRLKLAGVSPRLVVLYRKEALTLDQLMAFTVSDDQDAQDRVWESLGWDKSADAIRHALLLSHLSASDRRVRFVGLKAYRAAGGEVVRDLFTEEDDGYVSDLALLTRLAQGRLDVACAAIAREGWKWVAATLEPPYGHGLGRLHPEDAALSKADARRRDKLEAELAALEEVRGTEDFDDAAQAAYDGKVEAFEALDAKRWQYSAEQKAQSGVLVGIGPDGNLDLARGLLKPEDCPDEEEEGEEDSERTALSRPVHSMRLMQDLTVRHSLALREALAQRPDIALRALVHALALSAFYAGDAAETCLTVSLRSTDLAFLSPDLAESELYRAAAARHAAWEARLPQTADALWSFVLGLTQADLGRLTAHCTALAVDGVSRRGGPLHPPAHHMARAVLLDLRASWSPTASNYFGKIARSAIVAAVEEAAGSEAARRIARAKKPEMAICAEQAVAKTTWLPAPLRLPEPAEADRIAAAAE